MCLEKFSNNIFVFNLKKRDDRLEHIKKQFKKINCLNYTIIESVDGYNLENKTNLKPGMFGLVSTYLKLYDEIKNKNFKELIIVEDDCVFSEDFCEKSKNFYDNLPNDWSILYFGGNHNTHVGEVAPMKINDYVHKVHKTYSAHCIVVKIEIFEKIIEQLKTFKIENDVLLSLIQKNFPCYTTSEKITWQINTHSDIENSYVNYDWILKK